MAVKNKDHDLSVYLCLLLRHKPEEAGLENDMDIHGYVPVDKLIAAVNEHTSYNISCEDIDRLVAQDEKGRYRFSSDGSRIKCCQGHSIPWVEPEVTEQVPPDKLYHGTNTDSAGCIFESGSISKMKRHAVHMQADINKAWQSAKRWKNKTPAVLEIDSAAMHRDGIRFFVSDNGVWLTEEVPVKYILTTHYS